MSDTQWLINRLRNRPAASWAEVMEQAADVLAAQAAEIERLQRDSDRHNVEWHAKVKENAANYHHRLAAEARATAAEAERDALRERIDAACELAESLYHNPEGTLWNHGTTPTPRDRAEWKGVKDTAQDVLAVLDPDRARAALGGKP